MKRSKRISIIMTALTVLAVTLSLFVFVGCDDKEVTLTFMVGSEAHQQITGISGSEIETEIKLPVKTGYEFKGWKTSDGTAFTELTKFPKDHTTVYADLKPIMYSVKFNPNGGTAGREETVFVEYDQPVILTDQIKGFSKNGYELTGFAYSKTADAADFLLDGEIKNLTAVAGETVTLYAYYTASADVDGFVIENDTVLAYVGDSEFVTLPSECTKIADGAFAGNKTVREIYVPDTYTEIGFGAFGGCDSIEKMTLPFIGGSAEENTFLAYIFGAMSYAENKFSYQLVGSGNNSEVDENSLSGTFFIPRSLRIIVINAPITEIGEGAFYYAYGLEKVMSYTFADSNEEDGGELSEYTYRIKKVGKSAFEGCHRLGYDSMAKADYYMDWLAGVEEIGDRAFVGYMSANEFYASSLAEIGTLENVVSIGDEAFMQCNGIGFVAFGDKLERIGKDAFSHVFSLQRVVIPDSCRYIGESAFEQCVYLASVTIGKNVEEIGSKAFYASISLTEVIFEGGLPAMPADAFYGASLSNGSLSALTDVNPGTVFYFGNDAAKATAESKIGGTYGNAAFAVAHEESDPYYYIEGGYGFWLTFSKGHTAIIHDPYLRTGFGMYEIVGPCDKKTDVFYGAEIYEMTVMNQFIFTLKLDYQLSSFQTHYYKYKINSFTLEESYDDDVLVTIGKKTDEWYVTQNKYGQIALYHNGTLFGLDEDKGATYVYGGIAQTYGNGAARTFVYYQGNAYFEPVIEWYFIYVPDENIADENMTYYGTLTKIDDDKDYTHILYGYYRSSDYDIKLYVDAQTNKLEIYKGENNETLYDGIFSFDDGATFGDEKYGLSATDGGKTFDVTFTDLLEQATDGNTHRDLYARAKLTIDGEEYVLYNTLYVAGTTSYYITDAGERSEDDYYVLIQYEHIVEDESGNETALYSGFGERFYKDGDADKHDVLSYTYEASDNSSVYTFAIDGVANSEYTAIGQNVYLGDFTVSDRKYAPFYMDDADTTYTNGDMSITLSGYGRAVYTDADGAKHKGSYSIPNNTVAMQLFVSETNYYNMLEYMFVSDDGSITEYFVPGMYDSYDGTVHKGDMILPDEMRGKEYRIYDRQSGICTGIFFATGYGMGALYVMVYPNYQWAHIDDYDVNAAGATYVYYTAISEYDGQTYYRLANAYDMGFFVFTPTDELVNGKNSNDMGATPAYTMWIDEDYMDWWLDSAALVVTGIITPADNEFTQICSREEKGVYVSQNGYTLELDGLGNATLSVTETKQVVHTAKYNSVDARIMNTNSYPFEYTVGETLYKGIITVFDTDKFNGTAICFDNLSVGDVKLDLFVKGSGVEYDGEQGKLTVYDGGMASLYKDGKTEFGKCEKLASGEYVCRFESQKLVVTVAGNAYTAVAYAAIAVKSGNYYATAYYGKPSASDQYTYDDYYGFEVRYNNGRPVTNAKSIYAGAIIQIKSDGNVYYFDSENCQMSIVVYADGEVVLTYAQYDVIQVTCIGKYVDTDTETLIVVKDGNEVVSYKLR